MIADILLKLGSNTPLAQAEKEELNQFIHGMDTVKTLSDTLFKGNSTISQVSQITNDLGDQIAGRFIAPTTDVVEPKNEGFTGAFMSAGGEVFGDVTALIGSVLNGALQAGFTTGGGILGMSGAWRLTADGQLMSGLLFPLYFTATNAGNTRQAWLGMYLPQDATVPVFSIIFTGPEGTNLVSNGGAETGDLTGWTDADSAWEASTDNPYLGDYSFKHLSSAEVFPGKLPQNIAISAGDILTFGFASRLETGILSPYIKLIWKDSGASTISTDIVYGTHGSSWFATAQNFIAPATTASVDIEKDAGDPFNTAYIDDVQIYVQSVSTELQWGDGLLNAIVDGVTYDLLNPQAPRSIFIPVQMMITTVTLTEGLDASYRNGFVLQTTAAQAALDDLYAFSFMGHADTYTLTHIGNSTAGHGIASYYIDGVLVGTLDWNGATLNNVRKTIASIVIPTSGYHVLEVKMESTTGSDYRIGFSELYLKPAAY